MPTFRQDIKIGGMVPMMKTDDINDQAITKDKIRDGNITSDKLADGAVSTDKLPDGAIKTPKIADENITTSKLAEASVVTSKIADQNVTKEKIADQSVDNSKLYPEAVTYDKLKDKSVITEKLNDRAVTTEKIEEKAITNTKLGDQSVDGRVVREASLETKHFTNESVTTEKLARKSITKDKLADNAVDDSQVVDGSIGNAKLSPDSVTTEKIKDGSVTNEKVADDTIGIEKFDAELRKTIQAATGLPDDLNQMIQDVDQSVKQLHEKDTDLQSQIDDKQQQIAANDDDILLLQTRSTQMEEAIKGISASGGASQATAVTYENTESGLNSITAQGAIDELANKKLNKENIAQEFGDSKDKVVSQFALPFREIESTEFINAIVDAEDHFLFGIKLDGSIEWGKGIPSPIRTKLQEIINQCQNDKTDIIEAINAAINAAKEELSASITALQEGKVDKEEGKSLIEDEVKECFRVIENEEFIHAVVDANDKLLFGIQWDGTPKFGKKSAVEDRLQSQVNLLLENVPIKDEEGVVQNTPFRVIENEEFIHAVVDANDKLLFGIYRDSGKPYFPLNAMYHVEQNEEFLWVVLDEANHPLLGIRKDGSVDWASGIPSPIRKELSDLHRKTNLPGVINRNRDQESRVYAAARCDTYTGKKDFQLCLVGDPHDPYSKGTQNAVKVTNHFESIEAMLVLGDIQGWTPYDKNTNYKDRHGIEPFVDILDKCTKPWYLVVGNHDVGPCRYIPFARSHQQVWEDLIKPMVDRGFLRSNEVNSGNDYASKCYYYHDFNNYKVRLIVLYEYGFPLELEDSNEYWETIDYDESAMDMKLGTTYTYDANKPIVCNCSRYKEHSFKLKKSVTTPHITTENDGKMPQYKFRQLSFFTKKQMEWLASVLTNTPDGYGVIIASHQSLVAPSKLTDNKFSRGITPDNVSPRQDGLSYDMSMNVAIVPKIVDAWIKKKSISERIVASNRSIANEGNIEYLNTETDSDGKYAYKLNLDFSDRINNNAYFINYIAGHEHNDSIEQSVDYPSQKAIIVTTSNPPYRWMSDTATVDDPNSQAYDSLTIYSCNKDRIALVKYGNDITINGIKRDFEIIKL